MPRLPQSTIDHLREVVDLPDLSGTKYCFVQKLASGGMGEVFLVEDLLLKRTVALKVVHAHMTPREFAHRLRLEAEITARLEHPGIVPVHDVGILHDGRVFYIMKYVRGRRLDAYVRSSPPLPDLLRLFQRICEPVAFAHSEGVIHRDLKPENIIVGSFGEVLVMDWGVAKALDGTMQRENAPVPQSDSPAPDGSGTVAGTVVGTPAYMSPEQASGGRLPVGPQADIYSLGAILYFILTGHPPFGEGGHKDIPRDIHARDPASPRHLNPSISRTIEAITLKAIATSPEHRYQSAEHLAADVSLFLDGMPVLAYRENLFEKLDRWMNRNRFLLLLVVTYLVARIVIYLFAGR